MTLIGERAAIHTPRDVHSLSPDGVILPPIGLPERFILQEPEVVDPSKVYVGIATSPEDLRQRLEIVRDQYLGRGYITEADLDDDALYRDEHEENAINFVAKTEGKVVASLRLIPNEGGGKGLPIASEEVIAQGIYPEFQGVVQSAPFEWSQLAKDRKTGRRALFGLIRAAFAYTEAMGEEGGVAVIDNSVRILLNGSATSFGLPQIGQGVFYMGSESIPILININNVIDNSRKGGNNNLADFLETGKAPGYEWYAGA